jgi:hypothetical protein
MVIEQIGNPPAEFMEDELLGKNWQYVKTEWDKAMTTVAIQTNVPKPYASYQIEKKGGRKFNYDGIVKFYGETGEITATRKIEFKYGAKSIINTPQFLSLSTKFSLFREDKDKDAIPSYDVFWYQKFIDKYLACDPQLQQQPSCMENDTLAPTPPSPAPPKPTLEQYQRCIQKTNYDVNPFFEHLKKCENSFKKEKGQIVNESISEYLSMFGHEIDVNAFTQKLRESQTDKTFILWGKNVKDMKCHIDAIFPEEMTDIKFLSIRNKNTIVLESSATKTTYSLLLRWRNHKGILNPAWQISLKRFKCK